MTMCYHSAIILVSDKLNRQTENIMNEYYSEYLEGKYGETGEINFIESVEDTEWGVDFRIIDENVRDEYQDCLVFRYSNPMVDEEWQIGSFMSITEAVETSRDMYNTWKEDEAQVAEW